jgi:branched-chain amino acid transport system permease protein
MGVYLQFAVLGLAAGAVYVALADGLIAVYRATGVLNFAQGAMCAWGGFVYASLVESGQFVLPVGKLSLGGPMAAGPALLIATLATVVVGVLAHLLVFRPLRRSPLLAQVVASVGLMIVMQALVILRFGQNESVLLDSVFPSPDVSIFGSQLSFGALCMAAVAIVVSVSVWAYFKLTRLGIATRAGAQNERALRLMGFSPDRLAAIVWAAATGLGGLVVILAEPQVGLNPLIYTWAVIPALAVALIARLTSFGVACAAGLGLGSFQALVTFLAAKSWWPHWAITGVQDAVPFLIIVVALFIFGGRIPARGSLDQIRLPKVTVPKLRAQSMFATVAAGVVLLLVTSGNYRFGVVTSMILVLLAVSYVLLTGYLGQISLAQLAIAGTAGFALSKLTTAWHLPFPLTILVAATIAALLGVAVGLPALRIRGAQLAVVTLALAVAAESFVFANPQLTPLGGDKIASPSLLGLDLSVQSGTSLTRLPFCLMVLAIVVIVVILASQIMRGETGRAFLAIRSNERAAMSVGIDVSRSKLLGFALSAFIAGVAGCLIGYSRGQLSAASFTALGGLSLLAIAYLGGIGSNAGAVIAGLIGPLGLSYVIFTQTLNLGQYYQLVAGVGLILTAIFNPVGIAGAIEVGQDRLRAWLSARGASSLLRPGAAPSTKVEEG